MPARHAKLVRAKTSGLFFPEGCTIAFQPGDRLHQLTGLIVEDVLILAEEEISLVISNPGASPIQLHEGLLLGAAQPVDWLRDFTEPVGATCEKDVSVHPEMPTEHQDLVCGVTTRTSDLTERQRSLLQQLGDDGRQSIDGEARKQLQELLLAFEDTFAMDENELGCAHNVAHTIDTGDHQPIRQLPRRVPFTLRGKVEQMVEKMLRQGVIQLSKSPWASPVVLVAKKDGSTQF